jgi:hypothetical protein
MPDKTQELMAPEFASLPLDSIIGGAIKAVVNGQAIASQTSLNFINQIKGDSVEFKTSILENGVPKDYTIKVPTLSVVQVPALRIDSFTTHFTYEIRSVEQTSKNTEEEANVAFGLPKFLQGLASLDIKGGITHKSTSESTVNRSGTLDITVHASEAAMPEGLARVLSLMARAVPDLPKAP